MSKESPEELRKKYKSVYPNGASPPVDLGHVDQFLDEIQEDDKNVN